MAYKKLDKNLPLILLQHLRSNADKDGYVTFNGSAFALDHGISPETTARLMRNLQDAGRLEYTRAGSAGSLVRLIPKEPEPRKCPKCGAAAHDDNARFCYRCGTSLLTEQEQMKERIDSIMPRIYREIKDPQLTSELPSIMGKLLTIAFKED